MRIRKLNILGKMLIMLLMITSIACEDNLEPMVFDKLSSENFPHTPEDAQALVNGIYQEFRLGNWSRYTSGNDSRLVTGLFCTDEFSCYWGGYWGTPFNFLWQTEQFPFSDMYYQFVPAITRATVAIAQLESVTELDPNLKDRYIAEIKACRAYWMYDLLNMYGPIPVLTNTVDALDPVTYEPGERPTVEEMVALIEKDYTEAVDGLPKTYPSSEFGRMTEGAAQMGLLKLYMHQRDWTKAKSVAEKIIDLGVYKLENVYSKIWAIDNEQNGEVIFAIPCDAVLLGVPNNFRAHVLPSNWTSPNGYPVIGWNGYKLPWEVYDSFQNGDKRRDVFQRYYPGPNGQTIDVRAQNGSLGAIPVKYGEDPNGTGQDQGSDYVIYRYADVLLSLAEALNEINGPNQQSIDLINDVRLRAFVPEQQVSLGDFSNKEALRDYLLQERQWELAFEGGRREDLIRHNKFVEFANDPARMANRNPQKNAQAFHVLYPIPLNAINENKLIQQNPGY